MRRVLSDPTGTVHGGTAGASNASGTDGLPTGAGAGALLPAVDLRAKTVFPLVPGPADDRGATASPRSTSSSRSPSPAAPILDDRQGLLPSRRKLCDDPRRRGWSLAANVSLPAEGTQMNMTSLRCVRGRRPFPRALLVGGVLLVGRRPASRGDDSPALAAPSLPAPTPTLVPVPAATRPPHDPRGEHGPAPAAAPAATTAPQAIPAPPRNGG